MPAGGHNGRARCKFVEVHLGPFFRKAGLQIWAGDYNSVPAAIDMAKHLGPTRDTPSQQAVVQHCAGMTDTFRLRCPYAVVTLLHKARSARLDRV